MTPERLLGNPADKALFQITLATPRIRLRGLGVGSMFSPSDAPREAIILFPLQSEDPYMEERKANSLGEVRRLHLLRKSDQYSISADLQTQ